MKYVNNIVAFCMLLCCTRTAFAQQDKVTDSLLAVLRETKSDTARISVQGMLVYEYTKAGQIDKAKKLLYAVLGEADKTGNDLYRAKANSLGSSVYSNDRNLDSTLFFANRVIALLKNDHSKKAIEIKVSNNNSLAVVYSTSGDLKKSVELLIRNLELIKKIKNNDLYHLTIHNISASLVMMNKDDKAYEYMLQDVALANEAGSTLRLKVLAYLNATVICYNLKKFGEQRQYLDKAARSLRAFGTNRLWPQYYAYEAMYYSGIGQPAKAIPAANKALAESRKYDDRANEYLAYEAIRDAEAAMKNYENAKIASMRLFKMGTEDDYEEATIDAAKNIAEFSYMLGDYKEAFSYMQTYDKLKDSVQYRQDAQKVDELETRLNASLNEEKIARLESDKKRATLQIKNQKLTNILLAAACLFLLIMLGVGFLFYRNRKRSDAQQEKIKITEAILSAQEAERQRIARDLHDGLGGMLAAVKINLSGQSKITDKDIDAAVSQLDQSVSELRRIARNMMPWSLLKLGLTTSLKDLCVSLMSKKTQIEFQSFNISENLAITEQMNIYRIVQEILSNAIKHADADHIVLQCSQNENMFYITTEDNGKGFDVSKINDAEGIGLRNIKNRVAYMKGKIDIYSKPDEGTSINIELCV